MSIYFGSDFHFNHTNICGPEISSWTNGFRNYSSLHEMNCAIIDQINKEVKKDDTLYFLGDFCFGKQSSAQSLREKINCSEIIFIRGNHDNKLSDEYLLYCCGFSQVIHYYEFYYNKTLITLSHYPLGSWNKMGRGSFQLHGHCHGNYKPVGKQMDVGFDALPEGKAVISIDDVFSYMSKREIEYVDHHTDTTNY